MLKKLIWAGIWFVAGATGCVAGLVTGHPFYAFLWLAVASGLGHAALA